MTEADAQARHTAALLKYGSEDRALAPCLRERELHSAGALLIVRGGGAPSLMRWTGGPARTLPPEVRREIGGAVRLPSDVAGTWAEHRHWQKRAEIHAAFRPDEEAPLWIKARVALLEERLDTLPARDRYDVLARLDWMALARDRGPIRGAEEDAACLAALRQDIEASAAPLPESVPEPETGAAGAWGTLEELAAAIGLTAIEGAHVEPLEYVLRRGYAAMGLPPSLAAEMCRRLAALRVEDGPQDLAPAGAIVEAPAQVKAAPPPDPAAASEPVQVGQPPRTREEAREAVRALLAEDLTDREIARRVGVSPSTVAAVRRAAQAEQGNADA